MHEMPTTLAALDLNLLVVLHALLGEANVTRAARRVALSQSATSHALARLRAQLGDPLLVRVGRRLQPTARALALFPALDRGLRELSSAISGEAPFDPHTARRHFTLGMADYGLVVVLGPLLAHLRAHAPGIEISAVAFPEVLERLEGGTMDLALAPAARLPAGYSSGRLFSDGFVCLLRERHPLARARRLTLARYLELGHLLVAPLGQAGSVVDTELERRGLARNVVARVSSFLAAPILVSESDLITTGPERLLRKMARRYPVKVLAPPLPLPGFAMHLVWHDRRSEDPELGWLRGVIEALFKQPRSTDVP